ncbi:CAZyme family AA9 [Paecilomyces variotii]|nr:CAZyme family AA9 [Paecilomyces variotii]
MHFDSVMPALLAAASIILPLVGAHTVMTTIFVDGINQGDGVCIRMNNDAKTANFYIKPITSPDIACGIQGEIGASRVCPTKASSTLTFSFREEPSNPNSPPLDPSHKGPAAVYMKKVASATASNNAAGDGWFKIWESVYDESVGKWGTEKMIDNDGHISVTIPSDIEGGYYLARTELLALHAASQGDPQFYVGCAQLFVVSNGTARPSTVRIGEGTYDLSMKGLTYDIYEMPLALPYPMYGPAVYEAGDDEGSGMDASSPGVVSTPTATALASSVVATGVAADEKYEVLIQTEGLKPKNCVFVNGNWCGLEVPDYNDQNSCWEASDNCWRQNDDCWNKTQPTGFNNCQIWSDQKCKVIQGQCKQDNPTGPPNKGVDFTPKWPSLKGSMKVFTRRQWRIWGSGLIRL